MKNSRFFSTLSMMIAAMLIAATMLIGCTGGTSASSDVSSATASDVSGTASGAAASELGEGKTQFMLEVVLQDGTQTDFAIHTDEKTVGAALLKLDLIAGEASDYGLYIKTVNGVTADFDKDKTYWAFYVDGVYATSGADATDITDGATYALKIEK